MMWKKPASQGVTGYRIGPPSSHAFVFFRPEGVCSQVVCEVGGPCVSLIDPIVTCIHTRARAGRNNPGGIAAALHIAPDFCPSSQVPPTATSDAAAPPQALRRCISQRAAGPHDAPHWVRTCSGQAWEKALQV